MALRLLLVLTLALMAAFTAQKIGNQKLVDEHVMGLKNFTCKYPRIIVTTAQELLVEFNFPPNFVFLPTFTVLWRCDKDSGCCKEHRLCVPNLQQNMTLWFRVMETAGAGNSNPKFQSVNVVEHKECKCARKEKRGKHP